VTRLRTISLADVRTARGLSLLEMLLVIALIAVAGVLAAAVMTGGIDGMRLRTSGKQIAAQLRNARTQAITSGTTQRFTIDPVGHRWQGAGTQHGEIPAKLAVRFTGARQLQTSQGEGVIQFFEDGASTGGRIELQAGTATWRIDVAWITGQVRSGPLREAQ
jgi:general secretion pathway protein H